MITQQIDNATMELATILSLVVMIIAIGVYLVLSWKLYKNYKKTGSAHSKRLFLFFISTSLTIVFLIMELAILKYLVPDGLLDFRVFKGSVTIYETTVAVSSFEDLVFIDSLGWLCSTIAIFFGFLSSTIINIFALGFLDPKWKKTAIVPAVLAFLFWVVHSFGSLVLGPDFHHRWIQEYTKGTWDMSYSNIARLIQIPLLILPFAIATLILLYVSWKIRVKGRPVFFRSFLIALGVIIFATVYTFEIISPGPIITAIFRLGFVYFPLHMYLCLVSPDWFKKLIGLPTN
ncbi:MAG: hypothetical protein ACTSP4_10165 [Candidatus Hodarchaeales archaeon]